MGLLESLAVTSRHPKCRAVRIRAGMMYGLGLVAERVCIYALGTGDKDARFEGDRSLRQVLQSQISSGKAPPSVADQPPLL